MPISLAQVRDRTVQKTLEIEAASLFDGEKPLVVLAYRPAVLTPAFESELRAFGTNPDGWAALVSKLVASWDVEAAPGMPQPLEFEALREVPAPFLAAIVQAIREDISPNSPTDESSEGSFSPAASSAGSPSTTRSFEPLDTQASPPGN